MSIPQARWHSKYIQYKHWFQFFSFKQHIQSKHSEYMEKTGLKAKILMRKHICFLDKLRVTYLVQTWRHDHESSRYLMTTGCRAWRRIVALEDILIFRLPFVEVIILEGKSICHQSFNSCRFCKRFYHWKNS